MLTWHFVAPMVHDFAWAADKLHARHRKGPNDVDLHFLYKTIRKLLKVGKIAAMMVNVMDFFNKNIRNYPYKQYSFIQGGDGGICHEYVMLGNGTLEGILERLRMKWDILGSNTFWLQMI
jgi:hypothetical protein